MTRFWIRMVARSIQRRLPRAKITVAAIALSVAALVCVKAMMAGLAETMIGNAVAVQAGHILASWDGQIPPREDLLDKAEGMVSARTALLRSRTTGVLKTDKGLLGYAAVYGIDPDRERRETVISGKIVAGTYLSEPGDIVLGKDLADGLGLTVGQEVRFTSRSGKTRTYRAGGIFQTGLAEMDKTIAFARTHPDGQDSWEVSLFLDHHDQTGPAVAALRRLVPAGARTETWRQTMPDLVQLLALSRGAANLALMLVLVILALGISNTVFVWVSQRTREFGILKTTGVTPAGIVRLVLAETSMLVGVAAVAGAAMGAAIVGICALAGGVDLSRWTDMNPLFVGSSLVRPELTPAVVLLPVCVVIVCGILAGVPPARRAGNLPVVDAMRSL